MNTYFSGIIQRNSPPAAGAVLLPQREARPPGPEPVGAEWPEISGQPADGKTEAAPVLNNSPVREPGPAAPRSYGYLERQVARAADPAAYAKPEQPAEKQALQARTGAGNMQESMVPAEAARERTVPKEKEIVPVPLVAPAEKSRPVAGIPPEISVHPARHAPLPPEPARRSARQEDPVAEQASPPLSPVLPESHPEKIPAERLLVPSTNAAPRFTGKVKQDATPRLVIGRITVEILPPAQPAATRPGARPPAAPAPEIGSPVSKLTFGLGQF